MVFLKLIAHVETRWRKQWSGAGGGGGGAAVSMERCGYSTFSKPKKKTTTKKTNRRLNYSHYHKLE